MLNATPFLRLYAKYRLNQLSNSKPTDLQERELLSLVNRAKDTKFGREHDFRSITSIKDYQSRVPLRKYEDFWEEYWKESYPRTANLTWPGQTPYFAVSSGTSSGTTKYIPCTKEIIRSNTKAGLDLLCYHLQAHRESKIFGGKSFILGGSTELKGEASGIFSGDLSGISVRALPWWAKQRYFPPEELALLSDWEEKINILARESLKQDIRMISGVPSWLLIFLDKLVELKPEAGRDLNALFPNLELLVHGGVSFEPYREQFMSTLGNSLEKTREVYPASEGFIAIADQGYGDGLRLILDNGIFFEFVPLEELDSNEPTRHSVADIELDVNYAVVMTTCAGLWSYVIGDTVRFVSKEPPRLLITGRTSYYLSAFGEHLIAEEIEDAVTYAARECNFTLQDYSVGAEFPKGEGELGGHLFILEGLEEPSSIDREKLSQLIDKRLCQRNEDYEAHRADGYGLRPPSIHLVAEGSFSAWMKKRGKLGGQNKVPRIITKEELWEDLKDFTHFIPPAN